MSSIKDELLVGMKEAMEKGDKDKVSLIRTVRAAIKNGEIEKRKDFSNEEVIEVLNGEIKTRQKTQGELIKLGRVEESKRFEREIKLLNTYLPIQMELKDLEGLILGIIKELGAEKRDLEEVVEKTILLFKGPIDEDNIRSFALMNLE